MGKFQDCRKQTWRQGEEIVQPCFPSVLELKDGVCYGTCVEWLKRLYLQPQESVANRLQFLKDQGKLIGGRQRVYLLAKETLSSQRGGNLTAAEHFELMSRLLSKGTFAMRFEFLDGSVFSDMPEAVRELINQNYEYALVNVSMVKGGHAIAVRVGATTRLLDPNFGEFEIPQNDLDEFFDGYLLATALSGDTYVYVNVAAVHFN